ncbi:MAG: universal stress protein [bacterium]
MSRTILYPTDGSEHSERVESVIADFADENDTVIILHVVPEIPGASVSDVVDPINLEEELTEATLNITQKAAERLEDAGLRTETNMVHGDPGEIICNAVEDRDADAIFMGRRGRGTTGELLLGSVSHYVIHHADCPVMVSSPSTSSED